MEGFYYLFLFLLVQMVFNGFFNNYGGFLSSLYYIDNIYLVCVRQPHAIDRCIIINTQIRLSLTNTKEIVWQSNCLCSQIHPHIYWPTLYLFICSRQWFCIRVHTPHLISIRPDVSCLQLHSQPNPHKNRSIPMHIHTNSIPANQPVKPRHIQPKIVHIPKNKVKYWYNNRYCHQCQHFYPLKIVKHCPYCDICIFGYDHHCRWISKCIGKGNLVMFWGFMGGLVCLNLFMYWTFYCIYSMWFIFFCIF